MLQNGMYFQKRTTQGFTLIELLVVIAIIGLLSSVVLASLNAVRVKGRDAKRLSEMQQIRTALELYHGDHGHYPIMAVGWTSFDAPSYENRGITNPTAASIEAALSPYISSHLADPQSLGGDSGYLYRSNSTSNGTDYCILIYRTPENMHNYPTDAIPMSRCGSVGSDGQCTGTNAAYLGVGAFENGC